PVGAAGVCASTHVTRVCLGRQRKTDGWLDPLVRAPQFVPLLIDMPGRCDRRAQWLRPGKCVYRRVGRHGVDGQGLNPGQRVPLRLMEVIMVEARSSGPPPGSEVWPALPLGG